MPDLLPTLPGMTQGVVGHRPGQTEYAYDLQCQACGAVETPPILVMMTYKFPRCQTPRRRLCKPCHQQHCAMKGDCK